MQHRKDVLKLAGNTGMRLLGRASPVYREWRDALVSWRADTGEPEEIRIQEETLQKLNAKTWGVEFVQDGRRKFLVLPYGNRQR